MRSPKAAASFFTLCVLSLGCAASGAEPEAVSSEQSYDDAIRVFCNVDQLAGLSAEDDPIGVSQQRQEWLERRIQHPDVIYLRTILRIQAPEAQVRELNAAASKAGLRTCPLAESVQEHGAL